MNEQCHGWIERGSGAKCHSFSTENFGGIPSQMQYQFLLHLLRALHCNIPYHLSLTFSLIFVSTFRLFGSISSMAHILKHLSNCVIDSDFSQSCSRVRS